MTPVVAIFRALVFLLAAGAMLTAIRYAVLFLATPGRRREIASAKRVDPFSPAVEPELSAWRSRLGKSLWINLVGVPLGLFLILLYVGEYM